MIWKALARLSFKEFVGDNLWNRTSAPFAVNPAAKELLEGITMPNTLEDVARL